MISSLMAARQRNGASGGQTKLGNFVSVGTNATILPVTICDHVVIGAGAVVTKDITVAGILRGQSRASPSQTLADLAMHDEDT